MRRLAVAARVTLRRPRIETGRYEQAKSVFLAALDVPREARGAFVGERCGGDAELRADVERLLRHHEDSLGIDQLGDLDVVRADPDMLGEFEILGVLGRGGMGVVYLARRGDEPRIALKVLKAGLLSPPLLARFRREAALLERLDHRGIARFREAGVFGSAGDPQPYFAMEYVEGPGLREWARTERSDEEKLALLAGIADVVHYAHQQGVVHRDLKPDNILVRTDGTPCVLDFGVARLTESDYRATTMITSIGILVGTIRYMSPEQAEARPVELDARSDIYTLGVLGYELIAGEMPYEVPADSIHRALVAVLTAAPRPLRLPGNSRGAALEAVLGKALEKAPADRYASAAEFAADLRRVAAGGKPLARPARGRPGGRRGVLAALATVVLGASFGGAWLANGPGQWSARTAAAPLDTLAIEAHAQALIDSAIVRIHVTTRLIPRMREALAFTDSAWRELRRIPGAGPARAARQHVYSLETDAHLVLAQHAVSPADYRAAIAACDSMLSGAADGQPPASLEDRVAAEGSISLAYCELSRYDQPLDHLLVALGYNEQAELAQRARFALQSADTSYAAEIAHYDMATTLNDRGLILAGLAEARNSREYAETAIAVLKRVLSAGTLALDPHALASGEYNLGVAFTAAARLGESAALYDSALARLHSALRRRIDFLGNVSEVDTRLAIARALRGRARVRRRLEPAVADVRQAQRVLQAGIGRSAARIHPRQELLLRLGLAQADCDLAALTRNSRPLGAAGREIARADSAFGQDEFPLPYADAQVVHARISSLLWTLGQAGSGLDEARHHLAAAKQAVANHDHGRAETFEAGLIAPIERGPGAADLWYPIPNLAVTESERLSIAQGKLVGPSQWFAGAAGITARRQPGVSRATPSAHAATPSRMPTARVPSARSSATPRRSRLR